MSETNESGNVSGEVKSARVLSGVGAEDMMKVMGDQGPVIVFGDPQSEKEEDRWVMEIKPLSLGKSRKWQDEVGRKFEEIKSEFVGEDGKDIPFNAESLKGLMSHLEVFVELFYAYSPQAKEREDWMDDHATRQQIWDALLEVGKLEFPFVRNMKSMGGLVTQLIDQGKTKRVAGENNVVMKKV